MIVCSGGGVVFGSPIAGVIGAALGLGLFAAGQASSASKLARMRTELAAARYAADHDAFTRLPNRVAAQRELHRRIASGQPTFVALLDLDDFKAVNDTYGHQCGDDLLSVVASRLADVAADGGYAARLGGDEFLLFLPATDDPTAMMSAIRDRLAEPVRLAAATLWPRASFGVTMASEGASWRHLLGEADAALYQAKHAASGVVAFARPSGPEPLRTSSFVS